MFDALDFMSEKANGYVERLETVMIRRVGIVMENTRLTFEILRYFGSAEVPYPANKTIKDLYAEFPGESEKDVDYSVVCAIQQEFLEGKLIKDDGLSHSIFTIGRLWGLTPAGREYAIHGKNHYDSAIQRIEKAGEDPSSELLAKTVTRLVEEAMGWVDPPK